MNGLRQRRMLTAWMTSLVMLLGALAPLISQAGYRISGDEAWLEICTINGPERIAIESDSSGSGDGAVAQNCPWCNLHSGSCGLPPADVVFPAPRADDTVRLFPSHHFPRPRLAWSTAQPRAPPLPA